VVGVPRKPRQEVAGGVYHVFARGNAQQDIYLDDADRWRYVSILSDVVARQRWRCLAYCLMPNHVHLLLETQHANLGAGMQRLHGRYGQRFNSRHERCGHVFQGRYGAVPIRSDAQLWTAARYIALNPVVAGLCERPDRWRWSSHAPALGGRSPGWLDVARLLWYFGAAGGESRGRYAHFVDSAPA
jgi:putative transposase